MPNEKTLRIVVVDDHEMVREGLRTLVDAEPDLSVVGVAADGDQALRTIGELVPDVVLMDLSIPGSSGVALTDVVCRRYPTVRVIGVSRHDESTLIDAMLRAGARGYVSKQNLASQLVPAIRAVAGGQSYVEPALRGHRNPPARRITGRDEAGEAEPMTGEEENVLRLLSYSSTHREISERLGLSIPDVMTLKSTAMQKANLASRTDVVQYAQARGWLSKR